MRNKTRKKSKKKSIIIISAVLLFLFIIGSKDDNTSSTTNISTTAISIETTQSKAFSETTTQDKTPSTSKTENNVVLNTSKLIEKSETKNTTTKSTVKTTSNSKKSTTTGVKKTTSTTKKTSNALNIPKYSGKDYIELNGNIPEFSKSELTTKAFEKYSSLDSLGRCGIAYANICMAIMPTEERGNIGSVKPTGWHTVKYDFVDGKYLYNRCHLIGYQLSAENANERNLITGTRYFNVDIMLPFENMVADYVKETDNHVLYRVTPIFKGKNLVATGVQMEAYSVEDDGDGICFNVFCYNIQPGVTIDYATGDSYADGSIKTSSNTVATIKKKTVTQTKNSVSNNNSAAREYILNINPSSKKIHLPTCASVLKMKEENKQVVVDTKENLISQGYTPCKNCNP